jgi:hypothetical protein
VIIHGNDFYAATAMPTPTVGGSTSGVAAISGGSADAGTNHGHVKSYTYPVGSAGDLTVSVTETGSGDEDKCLEVYVLAGADLVTPTDGALGGFNTAATVNHDAPSISPSSANAFLICHTNTGGGSSASSYTPPSGMSEQYDAQVGGISHTGATLQLSSSGATGTKTFTPSGSVEYAAISIAIRTASGATAPTFVPPPARRRQVAMPPRPRRIRTTGLPAAATGPIPQAGQDRRTRIPVLRGRDRIVTPVPPQFNPPFPIGELVQPRRPRGLPVRRGRVVSPPWPQQTPPPNPDWIPATRRAQPMLLALRRDRVSTPPWPQQAAAVAPLWIPAERRPRPLLGLPRRDRGANPPLAAPDPLPRGRRPHPVVPPVRRERLTGPVPLATPALPLPTLHRRLVVPAVRLRRHDRLVLPVVAPPLNPPIVLLPPHHRLLLLPVRRRSRVSGFPLVGATPTECKVLRPSTGIVARGSTGTVARPYTGIVEFCTCCT